MPSLVLVAVAVEKEMDHPHVVPAQPAQPGHSNNNLLRLNPYHTSTSSHSKTMGLQSQLRNGSVKRCKKKATKAKHLRPTSRMVFGSSLPFIPEVHCRLCKKRSISQEEAKKYKHGHHKKCPKKPDSKNKTNVTHANPWQPAVAASSSSLGYRRETLYPMGIIATTNQRLGDNPIDEDEDDLAPPEHADFVTDLRSEMESSNRALLENDDEKKWATNATAPVAYCLAIDHILSQFEHRRKKSKDAMLPHTEDFRSQINRYYELFPLGNCEFVFPKDHNRRPSPVYHQIEGQSMIYLDWQLCYPNLPLPCPSCADLVSKGTKAARPYQFLLEHDRTNFSKAKGQLFPIWKFDGTVIWCVVMNYNCAECSATIAANDGQLLQLLPAHVAATYPVLPKYATGAFHLHNDASAFLETMMKTYGNGDMVSCHLLQSLGRHLAKKAATYLSQGPKNVPFPNLAVYTKNNWPPAGATLRRLYESAEYSPLQPYGYSNFGRFAKEVQSVTVAPGESIAYDHTFATLSAYNKTQGLSKGKAIFTGLKKPSNEVLMVAIVPSTSLKDASHALIQSQRKRDMRPSVVMTDTIPKGESFWKGLYGKDVDCQLGLFHFMHRIVDTLDPHSGIYWSCLVDLKDAVYTYDSSDLRLLKSALMEGTLSRDGTKYTDDEIEEMRRTKFWKQRYNKYLKKIFHSAAEINSKLQEWIHNWEGKCDEFGRAVFTATTRKATTNQFNNIKFVIDSEKATTYSEVKAPAGSKHNLSQWLSNRPESALEKFHEVLAHFCNVGCRASLADALLQRGWAEHNVVARYKTSCNQKRQQDIHLPHPKYLDKSPMFLDHSLLHHINQESQKLGLGNVFDACRVPTVDNGEVFLSKYLSCQVARNEQESEDPLSKQCSCSDCCRPLASPTVPTQEAPNAAALPLQAALPQPPVLHQEPCLQTTSAKVCFDEPPYYCPKYYEYLTRKASAGQGVLGKPPHDYTCPSLSSPFSFLDPSTTGTI
jgi:hypothetical protein